MMKFKITVSDEKGEIMTFEMPENSEFVYEIEGKEVTINNKVN